MKPALAFLMLAACASVVPSTAARLATIDPLAADPEAIEVAILLPAGLAMQPGSARLELGAFRGAARFTENFVLNDRPDEGGLAAPAGTTARILGLAPADAARVHRTQDRIAAWKREGEARGSLGIGLVACAIGDGPATDATGSVLIRLSQEGPFLPLVRDGQLADLLGREVLESIQPCKGAE